MSTRRALLVASPDIPNDVLPGARIDVENFADFLTSLEGGAWERAEIRQLFNPTKTELLQAVRELSWVDYAFLTFSGHGCHRVSRELSETSLKLTTNESCNVVEVNPRNDRHLLVIDACRAIVREPDRFIRSRLTAMANALPRTITREKARSLFEDAYSAADAGHAVIYSCKVGQAAGESQYGGYFSRSLVGVSSSWACSASPNEVLSVRSAFDLAQTKTFDLNAPQWAELEAGRRLRHFPLAVSVTPVPIYG